MDAAELAPHAQAITLEQLQVLTAIVETGSFSAAARALRKSQGSISYHVASLEEQLGVMLFDRSRRLPTLTTAGEAMLMHARRVLTELHALRASSWALASGLEPRLFVVLNVLFPPERFAEALAAFQTRFPSVDVTVRVPITRADTPGALREGRAEMGVISYLDRSDDLIVEPCHTLEVVPVVAPHHPLAERNDIEDHELQAHVHLLLSEDTRPEVEDVVGFPSTKRWRVGDESLRLDLLRAGLGWARIPRHRIQDDLARGTLVPLRAKRWGSQPILVDLYLARTRNNRPLGPAGQWLWRRLSGSTPDDTG